MLIPGADQTVGTLWTLIDIVPGHALALNDLLAVLAFKGRHGDAEKLRPIFTLRFPRSPPFSGGSTVFSLNVAIGLNRLVSALFARIAVGHHPPTHWITASWHTAINVFRLWQLPAFCLHSAPVLAGRFFNNKRCCFAGVVTAKRVKSPASRLAGKFEAWLLQNPTLPAMAAPSPSPAQYVLTTRFLPMSV